MIVVTTLLGLARQLKQSKQSMEDEELRRAFRAMYTRNILELRRATDAAEKYKINKDIHDAKEVLGDLFFHLTN
jgi:hypothetical protein